MTEYISKNAIKDAINKKARAEFTLRDDYLQLIKDFQMALDVIESIPAADVVPAEEYANVVDQMNALAGKLIKIREIAGCRNG